MNRVGVKVTLISGRTLMQGKTMEKGKTSQEYFDAVSYCEIDATTLETLGIKAGDSILVETQLGKVVVRSKLDKNLTPGIAFIPCGPYFNALIGSYTGQTGMPIYKNIEATIFAAPEEKILTIDDIAGGK